MQYIQLQIGTLPLAISCYENGCIGINRICKFNPIIDQPESGIQAIIDDEGICIGSGTEIVYGEIYRYKEMPELLAWLKAQNMELPDLKGNNEF